MFENIKRPPRGVYQALTFCKNFKNGEKEYVTASE